MRDRTNKTNNENSKIILPHGGYQKLVSYRNAMIVYDLAVIYCEKYVDKYSRTKDQMVQAARSGKQNIAEGSMAAGISKETEIKLVGVARASLEELLIDFQDFLRQKNLPLWSKDDPIARQVRELSRSSNKTHKTYMTYMSYPETAANMIICLIHQTNYLLDRQLQALGRDFTEVGGLRERLYNARKNYRGF